MTTAVASCTAGLRIFPRDPGCVVSAPRPATVERVDWLERWDGRSRSGVESCGRARAVRSDGAARSRAPARRAAGVPGVPSSPARAQRAGPVLGDGRRLRQASDAREVPGARAGRPRPLSGLGERGLRGGDAYGPPAWVRPPRVRSGPRQPMGAGQRTVAPADPGGVDQRRTTGLVVEEPAAAADPRLRLLPAVVADVRHPPGVVVPPQRRLRGSRRARVRPVGVRAPRVGGHRRMPAASGTTSVATTAWPTCFARSATTSACTSWRARPTWPLPAFADSTPDACERRATAGSARCRCCQLLPTGIGLASVLRCRRITQ